MPSLDGHAGSVAAASVTKRLEAYGLQSDDTIAIDGHIPALATLTTCGANPSLPATPHYITDTELCMMTLMEDDYLALNMLHKFNLSPEMTTTHTDNTWTSIALNRMSKTVAHLIRDQHQKTRVHVSARLFPDTARKVYWIVVVFAFA